MARDAIGAVGGKINYKKKKEKVVTIVEIQDSNSMIIVNPI